MSRRRRGAHSSSRSRTVFVATLTFACAFAADARPSAASALTCDGPPECCPAELEHHPNHQSVELGVVVMGVSNINERSGTWDADFYLYEQWTPSAGFTPQTEVVNEVARLSTQFDEISLRDGKCIRSRRIRSSLRTQFDLRVFPFDQQDLRLELSDDEFSSSELSYDDQPYALGFDGDVRTTLSSWQIEGDTTFSRESRAFQWEQGAPNYDYARVTFTIKRHVSFHLFKYFLPLLVIVGLAFSVFWIDPDDLGAPTTIGITCLLAAIAFQFSEASSLPEVSYLTLGDRCYVVCYVAIGAALAETIYTNNLARNGKKARAQMIDHTCRWLFPAGVVVAIAASVLRALTIGA